MHTKPSTPLEYPTSETLSEFADFEQLQRRTALLDGITKGERAYEEGRNLPQPLARARMARWLK
ncbi:hypothetical protein KK141_01670 [Dyella sp. LX-66]|uniref:hypothetical protein n=1 Tax=unclassified Dyella TaxID=2634549 RepID=UPI001BDF86AC|nr:MULTISPECIES: hypothetical protein [unclassified Dyella]MBT2116228.1 hypothetical protein [Dyella sp. LX-1]MBT2138238.1 hypothetical protein [Dyella sp. LX-66]